MTSMRNRFYGRLAIWAGAVALAAVSALGLLPRSPLLTAAAIVAMLYAQGQLATGTNRSMLSGCLAQVIGVVGLLCLGIVSLVGNGYFIALAVAVAVAWLSLVTILDSRKSRPEPDAGPVDRLGLDASASRGPQIQIGRSRKKEPSEEGPG